MRRQHTREREQREADASDAGGVMVASGIVVPLGLAGLRLVSQRQTASGSLEVTVIGTQTRAPCPRCGQVSGKQHDVRSRRKRDMWLREYPVVLLVRKRRFRCFTCRRPFTESDTACGWRRRTTARLRQQIGEQACTRPVEQVAAEHGVGPRLVRACVEVVVEAHLAERGRTLDETAPLPTPRFLGIDEFARRKGQRYDTILCDLEGRHVLEVSAERTQEEVARLLERLDDPNRVEAVSMDMSGSFRAAVELCLPHARVVADHFHIVQHVGKALGVVFGRCAASAAGRRSLKGQRHLFVRAAEHLEADEERERAGLAAQFPELAAAWSAKEGLRTWYASATAQTAAAGLDAWITTVERDGPDELRRALSAFRTWRAEILAFFDFLPLRLSNGFVEGENNRTKALMRQAYGYRNRRHLRARILLEVA
ncbi:MAG: ISL3-like element ISMac21 family transposase [Ktedonobacterales bacterium]